MMLNLVSHPLPKLWHICDGVQHATRRQEVGIVCKLRPADDAAPVRTSLEVWVLQRGVSCRCMGPPSQQ